MKIAIDVSPLSSGHKIRGVGFYLKNLLEALKKNSHKHEFIEFTKKLPYEADIVHYPYFDPFFPMLPFFHSKKIVVTVHDLTPLVLPSLFPIGIKGNVGWLVQKYCLQHVSHIITDSNASKKDIEKIITISPSKISSIYLAPRTVFFQKKSPYRKEKIIKKYNLPETFALYVGDVTPNKNVPRLVQATLLSQTPLVIVGKVFTDQEARLSHPWMADLQQVRQLAKKNPQKIHFLGYVPDEDLVDLYQASSALVMPSLYEGFGLPILEAMAAECPVVTSDKGSLKEVAGEAAYIVDPYNIQEIAHAIEIVTTHEKTAQMLQEKGRVWSRQFSWQQCAKETIAVYEKVYQTI